MKGQTLKQISDSRKRALNDAQGHIKPPQWDNTIQGRRDAREHIQAATEEYLNQGGKITVCPSFEQDNDYSPVRAWESDR
jgi:hypothetical protein